MSEINPQFEAACKKLNREPVLPDLSMLTPGLQKFTLANIMLATIIEAKNDGWEADWGNPKQSKWSPWPKMSWIGFSDLGTSFERTHTAVGSYLVMETSQDALEVFEENKELYRDLFFK